MLALQPVDPTEVPRIPGDYVLQWEAPAECPTADEVRALVREHHGPTVPGAAAAEVDARIVAEESGYALTLTTRFGGDTHVREMHASACVDLAEGTAIVIAVALEEGVEIAMAQAEPEAEAPIVPPAVVDPLPDPTRESVTTPLPLAPSIRARSRVRRPEAALRIAGGGEIGALGVITGAVQLGVGVVWPRARADVHGIYLAPRARIDDTTGSRATFQGGAVGARGCWVPPVRAVEIPVCGGFEAGTIRVGAPFALQPVRHTPWAGPLVGVAVLRAFGPVRLVLAVDATVRVVGSRFRIDGRFTFDQLPVSVRWLLGLEFRLGSRKTHTRAKTPATADTTG